MASTYVPLNTYTVTSTSAANIDFTSISTSYTDLVVIVSAKGTAAVPTCDLLYRVNNTSGNIYDGIYLKSYNPTAAGNAALTARYNYVSGGVYWAAAGTMNCANSSLQNIFSTHILNFNSYSDSDNKSCLIRGVNSINTTEIIINTAFTSSAISRLTFYPSAGNFAVGTTITIYGILAA